ncbi:hypothetical protein M408DRAFT_18764 [Serendipita vermifera MAFF 305830]|uniref:WD repeat-containing protein 75 second beta-propeller domain-containing protein n=1 Tax=Serendipita vermifera MAFF 305830 TaxID=933852 RepID=A0A0C3BNS4_SERVB|nr:hypothetical protein M408DRAFT_18764 [Serendipita vermifera MAFF 305830]
MPATAGEKKEDSGKAAKRAARKGKAKDEAISVNHSNASRGSQQKASEEHANPWKWSHLADPQVSKQPPVFTKDGKYFFVAVSSTVKIYSTTTGKVVSTLTSHSRAPNGQSDRITCLKINPQNTFQLFTGSADGMLRTWDFLDAVLLRTIDVGYPISHLCAHHEMESHIFVVCQKPNKKKSKDEGTHASVITRVCLKTTNSTLGAKIQKSTELLTVGKVRDSIGIGISASAKWLIVAGGNKIHVASMQDLKAGFTKFVSPEKLTCFALHPSEDWLATGDETGQIRLWYCLKDDMSFERAGEDKTAPTTTLHWHAHAVQAIEFTPNGAYLLSGGEESVLVIWQLHTGRKEFVPRVGAPIHTISVCDTGDGIREQEYLLGLSDGSLAFIRSSTLKLSRTIARVRLERSHLQARSAPPLVMQTNSRQLILPSSHPSSIQFYSPLTASLNGELEVSPSNRISRPFQKRLNPLRVDLIAVSDDGKWLATVDMRDGSNEGMGLEVFLKIWMWDTTEKTWDLNTRIDRPHGNNKVHSLAFSPTRDGTEPLLASGGGDANVKTWNPKQQTEKGSESQVHWAARTSFSYRNQQPNQVIWSPDGSILAVSHGCFVTLWSVSTNALNLLFTATEIHNFARLAFVGRNGRHLCATGGRGIAVFDLIRGQTVYVTRTRLPILGLVSWQGKNEFAVIHESTIAESSSPPSTFFTIFTPTSSEPSSKRSVPFRIRQAIAWQNPESTAGELPGIVAITHEGSIVHVGDHPIEYKEEGDSTLAIDPFANNSNQPALFQDIFGKSAILDFSSTTKESPNATSLTMGQDIDWTLLDGPSHLLPSLHSLFPPLIQSMLQSISSKHPNRDETTDEDAMIVDVSGPTESAIPSDEGRPVPTSEINALVSLFQDSTFTTTRPMTDQPPPTNSRHSPVNGKSKTNGLPMLNGGALYGKPLTSEVRSPIMNGPVSPKKLKGAPNGRPPSPPPRAPSPTIGKKRKKAMMA